MSDLKARTNATRVRATEALNQANTCHDHRRDNRVEVNHRAHSTEAEVIRFLVIISNDLELALIERDRLNTVFVVL